MQKTESMKNKIVNRVHKQIKGLVDLFDKMDEAMRNLIESGDPNFRDKMQFLGHDTIMGCSNVLQTPYFDIDKPLKDKLLARLRRENERILDYGKRKMVNE